MGTLVTDHGSIYWQTVCALSRLSISQRQSEWGSCFCSAWQAYVCWVRARCHGTACLVKVPVAPCQSSTSSHSHPKWMVAQSQLAARTAAVRSHSRLTNVPHTLLHDSTLIWRNTCRIGSPPI